MKRFPSQGATPKPQRAVATRRSRSSRQQSHESSSYVTRRQLQGGKQDVPVNPPSVTYQPWNSVTLVKTFQGNISVQANDILQMMRDQLDPTGRGFNATTSGDSRFVVQLRIFSVRAWNLTGRVLSLSVDDFGDYLPAQGGRDQLCGIVDTGTSTHTPAVGYDLPMSHRNHVIRTDDQTGTDYLFNIQSSPNDQCIAYIRLAYRFDGPVKAPQYLLPIDKILHHAKSTDVNIQTTTTHLIELKGMVSELRNIADKIDSESKPSLLTKVVDGVKTTAMLVSALSAEFEDLGLSRESSVSSAFEMSERVDDLACDAFSERETKP